MTLTPPSFLVIFFAIIFGGAGVAAKFGYLTIFAPFAFWLVVIGLVLLLIGVLFRGM